MDIAVTQRGSLVQVVTAAGLLDSQVVLSAIEHLKVTLEQCPCRAALLEFAAPRQKLRLWEIPGRWRSVFAAFPRFVKIAYVISGKALDANADYSCYFNHSGEVSGKFFHNCRDAIEWLDHYDGSPIPRLARSQRIITIDNATLKWHQSDPPTVNQRDSRPTHEDPQETHGAHGF